MNELMLLAGIDIPFPEARLIIHQPKLNEIAFIGENKFFTGCDLLTFTKDKIVLTNRDNLDLDNLTNFEIFMSIINDNSPEVRSRKDAIIELLELIFPEMKVAIRMDGLYLLKPGDGVEGLRKIDEKSFSKFGSILNEMFCLDELISKDRKSDDYNPLNARAAEIAAKLKRGKEIAAKQKGNQNKEPAVLSLYASILAVGEGKDLNSLMNYTVYQLFDEFNRFTLKDGFELYVRQKLAGAKDVKEVPHWMKNIHSEK